MPRSQDFSFDVPGSPAEVAERLGANTRYRLVPERGALVGRTDRPLGGRVNGDSFRVALNQRDFWTLYQAVARGRISPAPGGARVEGRAGLPPELTWALRVASIFGVLASVWAVTALAASGDATLAWGAPLLFGVVLLGVVFGAGINVRNADRQVPALVEAVRAAVSGTPAEPVAEAEAERRGVRGRVEER